MEALEKVFNTIKEVLAIIKKFFEDLGINFGGAEEEGEENPEA